MDGNRDFRDLLQCLNDAGAKYLIAGAYAVIYHTEPRYTKDMDIWVEPTPENAQKVWDALVKFGAPLTEVTVSDFCNPDMVYQIGVEPNRIDIIMDIEGVQFSEAWENRVVNSYDDQPISILNRDDTIRSKKTAGRPRDLLDVEILETNKRRQKRK
jgi:hypothetical protein